ncbi:uncharacterized protein LOC124434712 isoform X2 [Xenia sp. Carnegie-2017]|uniref:uncharacterized protein LOC124434712 isoform X2 n=1 Tax=Xenia sp. Carnegie-2017 TaxID=2897299 RepID=UPI001F044EEE|nr:uncharacterized protein LOC124434712 isoform X2 [Xenia sp. Carnegie-2017]
MYCMYKILLLSLACYAVSAYYLDSGVDCSGRKDDDICKSRDRNKDCQYDVIKSQCPRLCGECPQFAPPRCPEEYPFGCCWNGDEAKDIDKSNCPPCKDIDTDLCSGDAVKEDCNFVKAMKGTRKLCPETCNSCHDYGN